MFHRIISFLRPRIGSHRQDLLLILLVIVAFFVTRWVLEGAYYKYDLVAITVPLENLYARIQRTGQLPLWAPELAGGYPLLAIGQLGFAYLPHMILRAFLPGVWTLNLSMLLHAGLAALGTYWLLIHQRLGRVAAGTAALLLPLGAAFVGKYEMVNLVLPFMWLPLAWLWLHRYLEHGAPKSLLAWIVTNVFLVLLGHPQMTVYVMFAEALFAVALTLLDWRRWIRALALVPGVGLVIGLTTFYWLPILDNLPHTDRARSVVESNGNGIFEFEFTPRALQGLVIAHPFGHGADYRGPKNEAELSSYVGPVALGLAVLGLVCGWRRSPAIWLLSLLLVLAGLALALGEYSPVFRWMVAHGWKYFNAPARFFLYVHVGLVLFMALGLETCARYLRMNYSKSSSLLMAGLVLGTLAPALGISWFWLEGVPWSATREPALAESLRREPGLVRLFSQQRISDVAPNNNFGIMVWNPICSTCVFRQSFSSPLDSLEGIAVKLSQAGTTDGEVTLHLYDQNGRELGASVLPVARIVESEWSHFRLANVAHVQDRPLYFELRSNLKKAVAPRLLIHTNPGEQYDPSGELSDCSSACAEVQADSRSTDAAFRVLTEFSEGVGGHEFLAPYSSAGWGIASASWMGSLPIVDVSRFLKSSTGMGGSELGAKDRPFVDRFPITHLAGLFPPHRDGAELQGFSLVTSVPFNDEFVRLYKNDRAFPRIHFAERIKAAAGSANQRKMLLSLPPGDANTLVADTSHDESWDIRGNTATLIQDGRDTVVIATAQQHEGFLVLRDVFLNGWQATIDGMPVPIHRVDGIFRGVRVPAGEHQVVFAYRPAWLRTALYAELAAGTLFLGVLRWCWGRRATTGVRSGVGQAIGGEGE